MILSPLYVDLLVIIARDLEAEENRVFKVTEPSWPSRGYLRVA